MLEKMNETEAEEVAGGIAASDLQKFSEACNKSFSGPHTCSVCGKEYYIGRRELPRKNNVCLKCWKNPTRI